MNQFKKTPLTKDRLTSIGFEYDKPSFCYQIGEDKCESLNIDLENNKVYITDFNSIIFLKREFDSMESIKELITGLTGKKL